MYIDITLKITPKMVVDAQGNEKKSLTGHLGTHFDVMNKEFPLDFIRREAIIFDVSSIENRDIDVKDIDMSQVKANMFIAFYTGYIEKEPYGAKTYFSEHPQLSDNLIKVLLDKNISIIGIDCAGIRRGKEHTPKDQYCADKGTFVIENLCNLKSVLDAFHNQPTSPLYINTYPMNYEGMTGLPCRVVAEI